MGFKSFRVLALILLSTLPTLAQKPSQNQPLRTRGIIESFNAAILTIKSQDGQTISIMIPSELQIMANARASVADIKPGDFLGAAADKGPDGKLHAEEIHIFPEAMRGTGEGHHSMGPDLNRTMTNGTVSTADPEARTMTNGTVSGIAGAQTRTLKIEYKGGVQDIEVSPNVPIITLVIAGSSLLKPGATVAVVATQKDGSLIATRLTAEKDGFKPQE